MPQVLRKPKAVLFDKGDNALLYVLDVPGDTKAGKFVVRVNFKTKGRIGGKRRTVTENFVQSGGKVDRANLVRRNGDPVPQYDLVEGIL